MIKIPQERGKPDLENENSLSSRGPPFIRVASEQEVEEGGGEREGFAWHRSGGGLGRGVMKSSVVGVDLER